MGIARREAEKREEEFILPLRRDDSLLVGLTDNVYYLDLREKSLNEVADLLLEKLLGTFASTTRPRYEKNWLATFGLLMKDLNREELPPEAPTDYPQLCDWLSEELLVRLSQTSLSDLKIFEDTRNVETYSVRVSFERDLSKGPLDFGDTGWWELLELFPYSQFAESEN